MSSADYVAGGVPLEPLGEPDQISGDNGHRWVIPRPPASPYCDLCGVVVADLISRCDGETSHPNPQESVEAEQSDGGGDGE